VSCTTGAPHVAGAPASVREQSLLPLDRNGADSRGRVVTWQAEGSGLASAFQREMAFATFDPVRGAWVSETRRYTGTTGVTG